MRAVEALKLKRNDEVTIKATGEGLLITNVWQAGNEVKIQGWRENDELVICQPRDLKGRWDG